MKDVLSDLGVPVLDGGAVAGVGASAELVLHLLEAGQVGGEVFEDGGAVAQHVVAGEEGVFLLEDQGRVVGCVAGAVEGSERGPLGLEYLSMLDGGEWGSGVVGGVFEDLDVGADALEVVDAADVVVVPVRQDRLGDRGVFGGENAGEEGRPGGEAFPRVDEDALGTGADEVGVCAWSGLVSVGGMVECGMLAAWGIYLAA